MGMVHDKEHYDNYSIGNLTKHQLSYLATRPLNMLCYKIKDCKDYEQIKRGLVMVQLVHGRGFIEDISYILNKSGLTKWQKFKLKFQYMFL